MLICEFNGLPGCGKSTISNHLVTSCQREGISAKVYSRDYSDNATIRKAQWAARIAACRFRVPANIIRAVSSLSGSDNNRYRWDWIINYARICRMNDVQILFVDQGAVQTVLSLLYGQSEVSIYENKSIDEYIRAFSGYFSNCLIVNCVAPVSVCIQRTQVRRENEQVPMSRLESDGESAFCKQEKQLSELRILLEPIAKRCVAVDTTKDIAASARLLLDVIKEEI